MTDTALSVRDAVRRFDNVVALNGVSLDVPAGCVVGLLGPNGAGKTTLVRSVAGRVRLDSGGIHLFGEELAPGASRRRLGLVPQEIAVYPVLSARENLMAFGRFCGVSGAELKDRCDWALDRTGLGERAGESVKRFSGGMKRRLNIACGVLHRPGLIILDEPTVGVDPQSREKIYDMLAALKADGTAILMTTHHLDEAESRCDRIVIIDKGVVAASGTLGELVARSVGSVRHVTIRVDRDALAAPAGFTASGRDLKTTVKDVAGELGVLLKRVQDAGFSIEDVEVRGPGLHAAFLALTGKDLRE